MELMRDYLPNVKWPIIAIIVLFLVQTGLITSIGLFTDLAQDPLVNVWVLGGINFAFILCVWMILAWAGLRITRAVSGGPLDGAIGGVIAAVVAGFIIRLLSLLSSVSTLPVLVAYPQGPTGAAATGILGFLGIFLGVLGIIVGLIVDLVLGALFGSVGAAIHNRRVLDQQLSSVKEKAKLVLGQQLSSVKEKAKLK